MLITDWKEMENLWTWHMVADNARDAAKVALTDTSVDIFANPTVDTQHWIYDLVDKGDVPPGRVDGSAGRVLALKEYLGLLDDPFALLNDTDPTIAKLVASVGSDADKVRRIK
jgi:beta-glucosidase